MKQILLVFGTRPEAIKMAPLVKALKAQPEWFDVKVCVTGQHRQMLDQVLEIFGITPDFDLNIMKPGQDLFDVTTSVLLGMRGIFKEYHPDIVLVHGDTTTSSAVALAAFYCHIAVGHVEAGLRTYNIYSPWPEEINRQITGRLATLHFSPTPTSKANLLAERVPEGHVFVTGNTVTDALLQVVEHIRNDASLQERLALELQAQGYDTRRLDNPARRLILITGHRRENFGDGFLHICEAIRDLAARYPDVDFVYPMHLNPNVRKAIDEIFPEHSKGNLFFIEPLDYLHFVYLMDKSYLILTDSGGVQEEAPTLGKPVLVMRDTTERPEAVEAGTVKLVGTDYGKIVNETAVLLDDREAYKTMSQAINPYGDGKACARICRILQEAEL
mgnify:FL=1